MRRAFLSLAGIVCSVSLVALTCRTTVEPTPYEPGPAPEADPVAPPPVVPVRPAVSVPLTRHVLVVGDSEACAAGAHAKEVAESHGDVVEVVCKPSTTVAYWSGGPLEKALNASPGIDTLVVFLGTNHYLDHRAPVITPVLGTIAAHGLRCVWVGNTSVRGRHWPINGLLRDAVTPACVYFDTEAADVPLVDGVHPGPIAARRWLEDVWRVIPPRYEDGSQETQ